ncbi:hypothetical protein [Xanthomonas hydrangeae]|uniref:hypothetical protein n=1 Tax=Xanthomonas hydrangeae TaxID=2775159 RepID=UPI001966AB99
MNFNNIKVNFIVAIILISGCDNLGRSSKVADVKKNPDRSMGRQIFFDSCIKNDRHGTSLYDCADPAELLSVEISEKVQKSKKGKYLIESGYRQWTPENNVEIRVKVSGGVVDRRSQGGGIVFIINNIESFDVARGSGI